jgi:hypothetical protein
MMRIVTSQLLLVLPSKRFCVIYQGGFSEISLVAEIVEKCGRQDIGTLPFRWST